MEHVFFKPWIGKNYKTGGIFHKKILVVGESHYCNGCNCCGLKYAKECEELNTTQVVKDYLNPSKCSEKWKNTYRKFERSLVNRETSLEDAKEIWQSIAFFNFLQVAMNEARQSGTPEDYKEGQKAFLEVMDELQPNLIIVWGVGKLYEYLPGVKDGWIWGDELKVDEYNVKNGYYQRHGNKSRVIAIYHPSVGYSWDWWHKVIASQLNIKTEEPTG